MPMQVRDATIEDLPAIVAIYNSKAPGSAVGGSCRKWRCWMAWNATWLSSGAGLLKVLYRRQSENYAVSIIFKTD